MEKGSCIVGLFIENQTRENQTREAPLPRHGTDEAARRAHSLASYEILDSDPEAAFDSIAQLAALICNAPLAVICFFSSSGQWVKAGWAAPSHTARLKALPRHLNLHDETLLDQGHGAIPAILNLQLLIAMPLIAPDGLTLGNLIVFNQHKHTLRRNQRTALGVLSRQVMELLEMRRALVGLSQANARLGQQNMTDALTTVPNRRAYDHKLSEETARAARTGGALCLLLLDIDHFKTYNDEFGHPAGDAALKAVARMLQSALRPYDFLARYGGEEFAVILPSTNLTEALLVAERLRALVANSPLQHRNVTVSIGVSRLDVESGARALVQAADNGLYRAKATGRNKVIIGKLRNDTVAGSARR
ncbi:GGDEF domain-containing protein [Acidocella sp.]|uniref:GGDEF domain-containing protein n=1 Tax=Acidocella sp. TaxID=50710 RepID=UPI003CFC3D3E